MMMYEAKTTFLKMLHATAGIRLVKIRGLVKKAGKVEVIW